MFRDGGWNDVLLFVCVFFEKYDCTSWKFNSSDNRPIPKRKGSTSNRLCWTLGGGKIASTFRDFDMGWTYFPASRWDSITEIIVTSPRARAIWINVSTPIWTNTVDGRNPAAVDMVVYTLIYRVWNIPGGAGFLPSTVPDSTSVSLSNTLTLIVGSYF